MSCVGTLLVPRSPHGDAKYYSDDKIKEDEMGGVCSAHGKMRNTYNILIGNH
jgi:hypothetical protein